MIPPDLAAARRFLEILDPDADSFSFQTFDDLPLKRGHLAKTLHGPLDDHERHLTALQASGAGVFVTVNATDGTGRKAENITRIRAVFADLDGAPLQPVLTCMLEPHVIVESSPERWHAYWIVDGLALDQFAGLQKAIAARFGGDPSVNDLPRVMRMVGLVHQKAEPFLTRITHLSDRLPYKAQQILETFPPLRAERPQRHQRGNGGHPDSPFVAINSAALDNLQAWVPELFPTARQSSNGWRVSSADLGRELEEDLSITPQGAKYFGVADMGDPRAGKRTPIDLVLEYGGARDATAAARWLAVKLGIEFKATAAPDPGEEQDDQQNADRLERLVDQAATDPGAAFEPATIDFLAQLRARDPAVYERTRARLKKAHVRVAALDQEVERRKPETTGTTTGGQGRPLEFPEIKPWPEPVAGAALISDLVAQIRRYVILSEAAAVACALWVIHAHAHDAAFISPLLTALSPTKRCGKSSLLRTVARLAPRPISTSNVTPAAVYRIIEAASPTLLVDELDAIGDREKREDLRNASHCRMDARVLRPVPVGDGWEVRAFSAWAPIALAYIKAMPDTIRDRSIIVPMQRKASDQAVAQMRLDQDQGFGELARKATRWGADHLEALRRADPEVPRELNDRASDNWRCLLAIADAAGGGWPDQARHAAVALSIDADDDDAIGIEALRDLEAVFNTLKADRLASEAIVMHLIAMEGRPWAEFGRAGKPLTKHQLARLLKPFRVCPSTVKLSDGTTAKGYKRESFSDLWKRYFQTVTSSPAKESATFGDFQTVTMDSEVTVWNRPKPTESANGDEVTVSKGGEEEHEGRADLSGVDPDRVERKGPGDEVRRRQRRDAGTDRARDPAAEELASHPGAAAPRATGSRRIRKTDGGEAPHLDDPDPGELIPEDHAEMTLDDLDRMAGEDPDWGEFDEWMKP